MTELELYKKMYSTVVCQADQILQELPQALIDPNCGRKELLAFGERLKQALLDAEEIYVSAEDVEDEEDEEDACEGDGSEDGKYMLLYPENEADAAEFFRELDEVINSKVEEYKKRRQEAEDGNAENP